MTDGLLDNIIQLEKQIQAEIAAERDRAEGWQERELAQLQEGLAAARAEVAAQREASLATAQDALKQEGQRMQTTMAAWCEALQKLDDNVLRARLRAYLAELLPGGDHDHPHGQG